MGIVGAEVRKLTTVATTWVLTGIGLTLILVTSAVFTFAVAVTGREFTGSDAQLAEAVDQIGGTSIIVLVVGLLAMTTEFRHGTVGRTLQITPSRSRVLLAKMVAGVMYALAYVALGVVAVALVVGIGAAVSGTAISLGSASLTALWQAVIGLALTALLGVAVGALIRSQVVALTLMLVWVFIVESLAGVAAPRLASWLPFNALNAVFVPDSAREAGPQTALLLAPEVGLTVFVGYVLAAAVAAVALMRVRDV